MVENVSSIQLDAQCDEAIINHALTLLTSRLRTTDCFTNNNEAEKYMRLKLASRRREIFAVLFLDTKHCLVEYEEVFLGTVDSCTVHPREVMMSALRLNASAMILAHNHPSGSLLFSEADKQLTQKVVDAAELLNLRVLDHILVTNNNTSSMANLGIMPTANPS